MSALSPRQMFLLDEACKPTEDLARALFDAEWDGAGRLAKHLLASPIFQQVAARAWDDCVQAHADWIEGKGDRTTNPYTVERTDPAADYFDRAERIFPALAPEIESARSRVEGIDPLDRLKAEWQAEALEQFKAVVRGEGESGHGGEMVSVGYVEELLTEEAAELRASGTRGES